MEFNAQTIAEALAAPAGQQTAASLYLFAPRSKKIRLDFANSLAGCLLARQGLSDARVEARLRELSPWVSALEMIHTGSLYHDDVLDAAATRRGVPAAHARFPFANVLVAPYHIIAACQRIAQPFGDNRLLELVHEMVSDLEQGEGMQERAKSGADFAPAPALALYFEKNYRKTGSIFAHGAEGLCRLLAADAPLTHSVLRAAFIAGLMFQVRDDLLDYAADSGKEPLKDFRERIVTLPLFALLRRRPAAAAEFFAGTLTAEELRGAAVAADCEEFVDRCAAELSRALAALGDSRHLPFLARACHAMLYRRG